VSGVADDDPERFRERLRRAVKHKPVKKPDPMPRYNIELRTDDRVWETLVLEKDDHTDLRTELAGFVGEMLRDHAKQIWADEEWRIDVTDERGLILYVMEIQVRETPATAKRR
jgi:hypothetical protein